MVVNAIKHHQAWTAVQFYAVDVAITQRKLSYTNDVIVNFNGAVT